MLRYTLSTEEIFRFLKSCTIKNSHFADSSRKKAITTLGLTTILRADYKNLIPYYASMQGHYFIADGYGGVLPQNLISIDTVSPDDGISHVPMVVKSVDTGESILFTKANLLDHPKTAFAYRIGGESFDSLIERYPKQSDLIKSILHPVDDIEVAINAPNYTLLKWDETQLEEQEVGSIIDAVSNFLKMFRKRWDVKEFSFEAYYPITQWSLLWSVLPNVIFGQRIKNLKTINAHSDHIWEYLTSKGLGDYRAVLTHRQQMFLYRNINYLIANRGKQSTLEILAKELLDPYHITLLAKQILLNAENTAERGCPIVDIVSIDINKRDTPATAKLNGYEDLQTIISREREGGLEFSRSDIVVDNGGELTYNDTIIEYQDKQIGHANSTWLPTKLVELNRKDLYTQSHNNFVKFAIQTIFYKQSISQMAYNIVVHPLGSDLEANLTIGEGIALAYYCSSKIMSKSVLVRDKNIVYSVDDPEDPDDIPVDVTINIGASADLIGEAVILYEGTEDEITIDVDEGNHQNLRGKLIRIVGSPTQIVMVDDLYNSAKALIGKVVKVEGNFVEVSEDNYASLNNKIVMVADPYYIPTSAVVTMPLKSGRTVLNDTFFYRGNKLSIKHTLDVDARFNRFGDTSKVAHSRTELLDIIDTQFAGMEHDHNYVRSRGEQTYHLANDLFYDQVRVKGEIPLNTRINYLTYKDWFDNSAILNSIINLIESSKDVRMAYTDVANSIIKSIINLGDSKSTVFSDFTSDNFALMRQLFIQLCSYNITFLDTAANLSSYHQATPMVLNDKSVREQYTDSKIRIDPFIVDTTTKIEREGVLLNTLRPSERVPRTISSRRRMKNPITRRETSEVSTTSRVYDRTRVVYDGKIIGRAGSIGMTTFVIKSVSPVINVPPKVLSSSATDPEILSSLMIAHLNSSASDSEILSNVNIRKLNSTATDAEILSNLNVLAYRGILNSNATDTEILSFAGHFKLNSTPSDAEILSELDEHKAPNVLHVTVSDSEIISFVGVGMLNSVAADGEILSDKYDTAAIRKALTSTTTDSEILSSLDATVNGKTLNSTAADAEILSSLGLPVINGTAADSEILSTMNFGTLTASYPVLSDTERQLVDEAGIVLTDELGNILYSDATVETEVLSYVGVGTPRAFPTSDTEITSSMAPSGVMSETVDPEILSALPLVGTGYPTSDSEILSVLLTTTVSGTQTDPTLMEG